MQPQRVSKQKVCFWVVNGFTLASLALGLLSILCTMAGLLTPAALFLLGSVALDGCDGTLARRWRVTSPFGAQLDSLADMSAFGIASATLTYYWLAQKEPTLLMPITVVSGLVALMSAIRLARFNTTARSDCYFQGIPTTGAAAIIAILYLTSPNLAFNWAALLIGLLALLMVSLFPYSKLAQLRRVPPPLIFLVAGSALFSLSLAVVLGAALYMASGPWLWAKQRFAPEP
jgi:CDP-diacylglycerol--serine O-phosphatidyltransferase